MKPGTRVVSNSFTMGEWKWDDSATATAQEGCDNYCTAYLWIDNPVQVGDTRAVGLIARKQQEQGALPKGNIASIRRIR